jgi:hypothetical protein
MSSARASASAASLGASGDNASDTVACTSSLGVRRMSFSTDTISTILGSSFGRCLAMPERNTAAPVRTCVAQILSCLLCSLRVEGDVSTVATERGHACHAAAYAWAHGSASAQCGMRCQRAPHQIIQALLKAVAVLEVLLDERHEVPQL